VESHFKGIAPLQYPAVASGLRTLEHAGQQPVKCHLPSQTLKIQRRRDATCGDVKYRFVIDRTKC
jgi:hypothetical protein